MHDPFSGYEGYYNGDQRSGIGVPVVILILFALSIFFLSLIVPRDKTVESSGQQKAEVASGNLSNNTIKFASENQFNLFSDVTNNYNYYYGDQSGNTSATSSETTSRVEQVVSGDNNEVYISPVDGAKLCKDPSTGILSTAACK